MTLMAPIESAPPTGKDISEENAYNKKVEFISLALCRCYILDWVVMPNYYQGSFTNTVRMFPLAIIDGLGTIVAFAVAAWGTQTEQFVLDSHLFVLHFVFLALVNIFVFAAFRMYTSLWRYASVDDAARIFVATALGSLLGDVLGALVFGSRLPFRVYVCEWALLFIVCSMSRFMIRVDLKNRGWSFFKRNIGQLERTLIVGAGESGALVVSRMLAGSGDVSGCPVAYVDDDIEKIGSRIHGVRVVGACDEIPEICSNLGVSQIVVATPSASLGERRRLLEKCMQAGCKTLTVPERIKNISADQLHAIPVRDVDVADLLAREEVDLDESLVSDYLRGKTVLITGGGGSIGSEIARQLLAAHPSKIVLFDIYENTVYELCHELDSSAKCANVVLAAEIGSITHVPSLDLVFQHHRPDVVFHAAAHKHVPLMEANPREAIENNVFGTLNVVKKSCEYGCSHFVLISTDKAVNPTNVMGATKRMCELIVQRYAEMSDTIFTAVRFGNVLGSHGSVVPLFKRQLRDGGPITLTHRDITRYFMTIPEASRLVITAGALAKGGEIFILDMGEPVRIYDLAINLVRLSGLRPFEDIDIVITGLRPGEKLYEELLMDSEATLPTIHSGIMVSSSRPLDKNDMEKKLTILEQSLGMNEAKIKMALAAVVPTYRPGLD